MSQYTSGASRYHVEIHQGKSIAILDGSSLANLEHCFAVRTDKTSNKDYFTNLKTKEKSWELPDLSKSSNNLSSNNNNSSASPASSDVRNDSLVSTTTTSSSSPSAFRERVESFYRAYNPSKIHNVDRVLKQYEGNEAACIEALIQKYGPEPTSSTTASNTATTTTATVAGSPQDSAKVVLQLEQQQQQSTPSSRGGATAPPAAEVDGGNNNSAPPPSLAHTAKSSSTTQPDTSSSAVAVSTPRGSPAGSGLPPSLRAAPSNDSFSTSNSKVYGSPSRHAVTAALAEYEHRESTLTSYLKDREDRLAEANQRNDAAVAMIESLRQSSAALLSDMEKLKRENDRLISQFKLETDQLREASHIARNEWHRERQQLEAAAEDAAASAIKALQQERLKQGELNVKYIGERATLQTELKAARDELRDLRENSSNLLSVLERREEEHRKLVRQIEDLKANLRGEAKSTRETQTDPLAGNASDFGGSDEPMRLLKKASSVPKDSSASTSSPSKTIERTLVAMEEFDRVMAVEKFRRNELEQLRTRCAELERELRDATDTSLSRIARTSAGAANVELQDRLRHYRATIGALRNSNRVLEERIVALEKKCASLSSAQTTAAELQMISNKQMVSTPRLAGGEVDVTRLRQTVKQLTGQLTDAKKTMKEQRQELLELRARLTSFMAAPR